MHVPHSHAVAMFDAFCSATPQLRTAIEPPAAWALGSVAGLRRASGCGARGAVIVSYGSLCRRFGCKHTACSILQLKESAQGLDTPPKLSLMHFPSFHCSYSHSFALFGWIFVRRETGYIVAHLVEFSLGWCGVLCPTLLFN